MRIQIKGKLTPERLVDAFNRTLLKLQTEVNPDIDSFWTANLYLHTYDKYGNKIETSDNQDDSLIISYGVADGEFITPPKLKRTLTPEELLIESNKKLAKQQARKEAKQKEEEYIRKAREENRAYHAKQYQLSLQAMAPHNTQLKLLNKATNTILSNTPTIFIQSLNNLMDEAWATNPPQQTKKVSGVKKTSTRLKPIYSYDPSRKTPLRMTLGNGSPRGIQNPLFTNSLRQPKIDLYTKDSIPGNYPEWITITKPILNELLNVLTPDEEQSYDDAERIINTTQPTTQP